MPVQGAKFPLPGVIAIVLDITSAVMRTYLMTIFIHYGMDQHHSVMQVARVLVVVLIAGGQVNVEIQQGVGQEIRFCVDFLFAGLGIRSYNM